MTTFGGHQTRRSSHAGSMLAHCLRLWPYIKPTLFKLWISWFSMQGSYRLSGCAESALNQTSPRRPSPLSEANTSWYTGLVPHRHGQGMQCNKKSAKTSTLYNSTLSFNVSAMLCSTYYAIASSQQTRIDQPMLAWCWPSGFDAGPTSIEHCISVQLAGIAEY